MTKFDWPTMALLKGVLREPTPDESRIILWRRGRTEPGYQYWERIANVPGAEILEQQGVCFTPATSMPARQKLKGLLGKLVDWLRKPAATGRWMLPTGEFVEETGTREQGLLFAWQAAPAEATTALPTAWLGERTHWQVGANLFVVGPGPSTSILGEDTPNLLGNPKVQAEQRLAEARKAGDRHAEISALIDLGIASARTGDGHHGLAAIEEALTGGAQPR